MNRLALLTIISIAPSVRAQSFDVASIQPSTLWKAGGENSNSRSSIEASGDRLTLLNINVDEMIQWAYKLQPFQISGRNIPRDKRYDVRTKSPTPVPDAQLRVMLQDLLATRFKLKVHREPKNTPVFELVVAKGGPKLPPNKAAQPDASSARENLPRIVDGSFLFVNVSMGDLAEQLSQLRPIGRPVLDRTRIKGMYDITLKSAASAMLQPDGESLFTLLQEQLGLKLVDAKDATPILIVDSVEERSAN